MARYYFNVTNDLATKDALGLELSNLDAARHEARKDIRDIIGTRFNSLGNWTTWSIEICDKKGKLLLSVPFLSL